MTEPKTHALTTERLRERLNYNFETGVFTWRTDAQNGHPRAGSVAGFIGREGYVWIKLDGIAHQAHRLAWHHYYGVRPDTGLDHINGVRDANRIANLRKATNAENLQNRKARTGSTSRFVGVSWYKPSQKWAAKIRVSGQLHNLGYFDREEDAYEAYLGAKRKHHLFWASNSKSVLADTAQK